MSDSYTMNTKELDKLIKALKGPVPYARVGVLGSTSSRNGAGPSNADVGAFAEFGTATTPIRSWLRQPLIQELPNRIKDTFDENMAKKIIEQKSLVPWVKLMGVIAEGVVLEGFDTAGFGEWEPSNMSQKKNHQTLVETGQLRNSVTHDVVGD